MSTNNTCKYLHSYYVFTQVGLLMFVISPIAWPLAKLLDMSLGGAHSQSTRFNRRQLGTLVTLHQVKTLKPRNP